MILGQVRWIRYFHTVPKQTERTGLIPFALFPDTVWIKKSNPKVPCHGIRTTLNTLVSFLNIQRITRDVNMKFTAYHTPACHTHHAEQFADSQAENRNNMDKRKKQNLFFIMQNI